MQTSRRRFLSTAAGGAACPLTAGPAARPNILFFFPDQLRHDFIEPSAGIPVRTPNIRQLASKGVRFTQAVTPAPLCAPARACLASGLEYDRCRVPSNRQNYPLDQPIVYQRLRTVGYHVMGCGKFDLHKADLNWGLDGKRLIADWGFSDGIDNEGKHDATIAYTRNGKPMGPFMAHLERLGLAHAHIEDYEKRQGQGATFPTPLPDSAYGDNWIARNGLALLDAAPRNKPWFLQVNFNGPHAPWDITASMEKRWRGIRFPQPTKNTQLTADKHVLVRENYAAMIENIDTRIGEIVEKVRQRGELENTLIVVSSDHGEMLGDHNLWGKTQPYHGSTGVPLVVSGLEVRPSIQSAPATSLDVTATILDYAGAPALEGMDSKSLRPVLSGGKAVRTHVLSGMGSWRMALRDQMKYVRRAEGGPLLFDLKNDPQETENRAADRPGVVAEMERLLPRNS
jgi:arylsulfatase A-like enzyme